MIKTILKKIVRTIRTARNSWLLFLCSQKWKRTQTKPSFLDATALARLDAEYPTNSAYKYDAESLKRRGEERAVKLIELFTKFNIPGKRTLEVGCHDGMVSCALAEKGYHATATDQRSNSFDPRAKNAGVELEAVDAAHLPYGDNSFDAVFSYDTFEHLADPETSLHEMLRVLKPGGIFFAYFGPLAMSARGTHAYKIIGIPYVQHLFPKTLLDEYLAKRNRGPIDYAQLNNWRLSQFETLFKPSNFFNVVLLDKELHFAGYKVFMQYTSCLKSKSSDIRDFVVANMTVVLRKK